MRGNFGFIHEKLDIKILVLFILRRLPEPVEFDVLTELVMCDGGISYFDFAECVSELVKTEHIKCADNKYSLTAKGIRNSEITEISLPFTVRMEAEKATYNLRIAYSRNAMIKTSHSLNQDGSASVVLSLSDGVGDIVILELFAVNERQALAMESGFRKNAEGIYNALIKMMFD